MYVFFLENGLQDKPYTICNRFGYKFCCAKLLYKLLSHSLHFIEILLSLNTVKLY